MSDAITANGGVPAVIAVAVAVKVEVALEKRQAESVAAEVLLKPLSGDTPELWLYRDRTAAMLRRYGRLSVEVGRLPSLLGREFFRTGVTSYRVGTFED